MKSNETRKDSITQVLVIGGGISGLAAAYYLQTQARSNGLNIQTTVLESKETLGGKIVTEKVGGFTIEGGPDCFLRQKPWAADLIRELGIDEELMGTNDDKRKVFVLNKGKLTPLPDGVMLIVPTRIWPFVTSPLISWPGKIRMGMDLFIPPYKNGGDESVADFVRRRLGSEALEKIAEPLLSGVHVSDPEDQSLLATFPRFRNLEAKHGNLIRGMLTQRKAMRSKTSSQPASQGPSSIFISMRQGMSQLIDSLQSAFLKLDGQIKTGMSVEQIERGQTGGYSVLTQDGQKHNAHIIVLATPSDISAHLMKNISPDLSRLLQAIKYVSTATVSLGYRTDQIGHSLNGFGFVIPRQEKRQISASTWTSTKFNHRVPEDHALIRCFVGGPGHEEVVEMEDTQILELVKREVKDLMGITAEPVISRIFRWRKGHPQYNIGHLERMKEINKSVEANKDLYITGSSYGGVGLPDCVRQGKETALQVIQSLSVQTSETHPV